MSRSTAPQQAVRHVDNRPFEAPSAAVPDSHPFVGIVLAYRKLIYGTEPDIRRPIWQPKMRRQWKMFLIHVAEGGCGIARAPVRYSMAIQPAIRRNSFASTTLED